MSDNDATMTPHSTEAEQQVLGALLCDNRNVHAVRGMLRSEHFFDPVHGRIFKEIVQRTDQDMLASPVTLKVAFENDEGVKELGGAGYLARLAGASVMASAVKSYADLIVDCHAKREIISVCDNAMAKVAHGGSTADAVSELELYLATAEDTGASRSTSFLKATTDTISNILHIRDNGDRGIPTGLHGLDALVSFAASRYTILGASTSMGKTALAAAIAHHAAKHGHGVAFASLEMGETDVASRINSIDSGVPYKAFDRPMSDALLSKVVETAKAQEALPVQILGPKARDVPAIMSECRRLQHRWPPRGAFKGLKLLVVDYIQLVEGKGENRFVQLGKVANGLKQVSKILDVHVLALAQLDRKLGERDDPRPRLSDLRESGDLEMAPDNVIFLHRPEYFLQRKGPPKKPEDRADFEAEMDRWKGRAQIIVAKNRMGELGDVEVGVDLATNRFWSIGDTQELDF